MSLNSQFSLTEDQQSLLEHTDRFAREQMYPLAQKMDNEEWWPENIFKRPSTILLLDRCIPYCPWVLLHPEVNYYAAMVAPVRAIRMSASAVKVPPVPVISITASSGDWPSRAAPS